VEFYQIALLETANFTKHFFHKQLLQSAKSNN